MILIGTMDLSRTCDTGDFYCPGCGTSQTFRLRTRRPFLTLYFIPVVPIGGAEPFVQCDQCRAVWDPHVLEMGRKGKETAAADDQFRSEALRAAILMTTADGMISEPEIEALHAVAERLLDWPVDREELGALCSSVERLGIPPINYMLSVSTRWSKAQRTTALQAAFLAASAEGALSQSQLTMFGQLKEIFGLTDEEYQSAIEAALLD